MKEIYLPSSENYVYESDHEIVGFISIYQNIIAALFVAPEHQGKGVGSQLMSSAKDKYNELSLSVYKKNHASISFYKKHGFITVREQIDPHTDQVELFMKSSP